MIVVDVETGGLDPKINPLLSIGAVDYDSDDLFYVQIKPIDGLDMTKEALSINDYDPLTWNNTDIKKALLDFVDWCKPKSNLLAGHNPYFDLSFLQENFKRCGISSPFKHRTIDLHTLSYVKFQESLTMEQICQRLGIEPEPKPHSALWGAKKESQCFKKLLEIKQ